MKENIAEKKCEDLSLRIIDLYEDLEKKKIPKVLLTQILKSGTSIGANLAEGIYAISEKDFLNKIYISLKECSETRYWLRLFYKANYINQNLFDSLYSDVTEILKILNATTKTLSKKLNPS